MSRRRRLVFAGPRAAPEEAQHDDVLEVLGARRYFDDGMSLFGDVSSSSGSSLPGDDGPQRSRESGVDVDSSLDEEEEEEERPSRTFQGLYVARLKAERDEGRGAVECLYRNPGYDSGSSCSGDDRPASSRSRSRRREEHDGADCVVLVGEAVFPCRRALLDCHSGYLARQRSRADVLYLPEELVSPAGFQKLYLWLRAGGGARLAPGDAREVLDAAEFLGVKAARRACLEALGPRHAGGGEASAR